MVNNNLPTAWQSDDIVDGLDTIDKSELLGTPIRLIGCTFNTNNEGVSTCYIDVENLAGEKFTFTDSSTGVRAQLVKYLTEKGLDHIVESGEYAEFKLVAPNGLRISEYEVPMRGPNGQVIPGKMRSARTYYLTTNGERGARSKATESKPAAKPTTPRASANK
jgi:hypothetical protein